MPVIGRAVAEIPRHDGVLPEMAAGTDAVDDLVATVAIGSIVVDDDGVGAVQAGVEIQPVADRRQ